MRVRVRAPWGKARQADQGLLVRVPYHLAASRTNCAGERIERGWERGRPRSKTSDWRGSDFHVWSVPSVRYSKEAPLVTILNKSIGTVASGVVLCLSLSHGTQAEEYKNFDPCAQIPGRPLNPVKCREKTQQGIHTITGEILHMNGANLLVKKTNGEEVLLRIDLNTQLDGQISTGNRIEANVNAVEGETYVLSLNKTR